jgi:hypothetical protein
LQTSSMGTESLGWACGLSGQRSVVVYSYIESSFSSGTSSSLLCTLPKQTAHRTSCRWPAGDHRRQTLHAVARHTATATSS